MRKVVMRKASEKRCLWGEVLESEVGRKPLNIGRAVWDGMEVPGRLKGFSRTRGWVGSVRTIWGQTAEDVLCHQRVCNFSCRQCGPSRSIKQGSNIGVFEFQRDHSDLGWRTECYQNAASMGRGDLGVWEGAEPRVFVWLGDNGINLLRKVRKREDFGEEIVKSTL